MNIRARIWEVIEVAKSGDRASRIFDIFILTIIFLNVIAVIIGTVHSVQQKYGYLLNIFEICSVIIFTVEYLARLWSCTADARYNTPFSGRVRFAIRPMTIVDLLAFLPFYLPFTGLDLRALRILRLMRIVRIAKVARYYSSLNVIKNVFYSKKEELILTFVIMIFVLIISSNVLYYCENTVQPDKFSSIPATMWWSVATLTTVGYGDIYPVTLIGRFCASIISIIGIAMFALPTGILGAGFVEEINKKKSLDYCPHCGQKL